MNTSNPAKFAKTGRAVFLSLSLDQSSKTLLYWARYLEEIVLMSEPETDITCIHHPKVPTNLRCASCGTPICPHCLVHTPVGAKCRDCATDRANMLLRPTLLQSLAACIAGLVGGAVAGLAVQFDLGLLTIFLAILYGSFVGKVVLMVVGRKRSTSVEVISAVGIVAGSIAARMLAAPSLQTVDTARPPFGTISVLVDLAVPTPIPLISLIAVILACITRIRCF